MEKILTQKIKLNTDDVSLYIRREDLIHPFVSGNKFRKLKYNLIQAKEEGLKTLLTFGGAFSNHIAATAAAGKEHGFKTMGVIRGEELADKVHGNPTLLFARQSGMELVFVSREEYKLKSQNDLLNHLEQRFGPFYLLPEGGSNALAVKGCEEILTPEDSDFDYICVSVGTGGTISGIMNSAMPSQKILGFPALKGDFLKNEIRQFSTKENMNLITDYHFEGYGKINADLIEFINTFYKQNNIPLDPVYTGKMMYGIFDLIAKDYFPKGTKILAIHTGGIQGIEGMNQKLKSKKLPLIYWQ
ncbi:1-aminocyclopropane-1-carboxylate deaminase/D-cysteine desulfhydrase [Flavobacterium sp. GT3R68]|uniref:1-aminocyclopropane-1-carboxylate deaminase/D-cysteine desulfhydrase n=1 Tax=Flavobacterium sp. GT3R68 TaxID=2594437 RepID=UPI0021063312|nr:pyridoxal-phosphate dependent enzyme [Flavobacterium sp. GT3R68]